MNKKINTYMMAAMMAVVSPAIMGQTASDGVKVICNDVVQKGDSVYIDAVVTVSGDAVKSRSYLELTPVLESASQKEGLPSILVNGRIRQKVYNREVALDNLNDVPHYTILKANKEDQVVSYKTAVPFEDWMKDARVVLDPNLCGCGKEEAGSPLLIADKIRRRPDKRYEVQPTFSYITPMAETEKHRAEVGTAFLDFQVGKYQILPDFRNNAVELAKINNTIRTVTEDKNVKPTGIVLKGYASPGGSYASNKKLADNRVKALRDYIRQKNDFKADFFTMSSEPEDWAGFKEKVEADPNVPNRSEVLAIIDSSDDPDRKEAKLRALGGGAAFRYVLKDIFPSLRRSEYKIDYTVREFTVDEGREIIKTRPQQLSLGEMFAVANSYEIGSDEYNNVFDIAVRMFPNDPVANLNAANIAMGKGDYASAKNYLAKAGNAPEAVHAKGVLSMLTGDLTEAESLLKQAQDMGVKAAAINLEELRKKIEDNAVFDSFNAVK